MARALCTVLMGAAVLLTCLPAGSQPSDTEARLREQLRETTLQLRQVQDENAALRAREQQAPAPAAPSAAPSGSPERAAAQRRAIAERDARIEQLSERLTQYDETIAQWREQIAKAQDLLRQRQEQVSQLELQAQRADAAFKHSQDEGATCIDKNKQLVTISGELLAHYEQKGVWSALRDAEPLTGIHRVQLETLAQEYHIKIKDQTLAPGSASKPAAPHP